MTTDTQTPNCNKTLNPRTEMTDHFPALPETATRHGAPVFLIGYMGAGKTTFGRALARVLGREFIDLDFYIEQRFHTSVPQLFTDRGEAEFRRIEASMLREAGEFDGVVVACGGGTPCFGGNMDYMLDRGFTVLLRASDDCLLRRLMEGGDKRPLVRGKSREELRAFMADHMARRAPFYERAHVRFDGENLENTRQISRSVKEFLEIYDFLRP